MSSAADDLVGAVALHHVAEVGAEVEVQAAGAPQTVGLNLLAQRCLAGSRWGRAAGRRVAGTSWRSWYRWPPCLLGSTGGVIQAGAKRHNGVLLVLDLLEVRDHQPASLVQVFHARGGILESEHHVEVGREGVHLGGQFVDRQGPVLPEEFEDAVPGADAGDDGFLGRVRPDRRRGASWPPSTSEIPSNRSTFTSESR